MRMKETFGVDHIIVQPSVDLLKKLNRLGFKIMGDMNWHNHSGIMTMPMKIAVKFGIPLVFWGEHGWTDQKGMYSMNDFWKIRLMRYGLQAECKGYFPERKCQKLFQGAYYDR